MTNESPQAEVAGAVATSRSPALTGWKTGPTPQRWGKGDTVGLAVVLLVALGIRGLYIYQQRAAPDFGTPVADAEFFHQWASGGADAERITDGPYYRAPLYPWCLGLTYRMFGIGPVGPRVVQGILGALTCGLAFVIGRLVFGRSVGLLAGLATASYWVLVYFTGELLIPTLITFLDAVLVLLLLRCGTGFPTGQWRRGMVLWGLAGVVLGLSGIARPNVLLFAPVVLVWILTLRTGWPRAIPAGAVFTAGCLLPVLPVTIRNYVVGDDLVLVSCQAGVNLYIGNNPQADGYNVMLPGTRPHWQETYLDQIAIAERAEGRKLKASEVSGYYLRQTWKFVSGEPKAAASLMYGKLKNFWNGYEFANNKDLYDYTGRYTPVIGYLPLSFGVVAPLGLLGIAVHWPRRRELFPLWGFLLVYMASVVLFFVSARFRVPVLPVLMVYGAAACGWLFQTARQRRWRPLAEASALLVLLAVFCNARQAWSSAPGGWDLTTAAMLAGEGKVDRAVAEYQRITREYPSNHEAHGGLAALYVIRGDPKSAEASARRAIELNPNYAKGHDTLGAALTRQGRLDEALLCYRRSVQLVPHQATARQHLGQSLLLRGDLTGAEQHLAKAAELEPDRADVNTSLGRLLARQGQPSKAIEHFRKAVGADPTSAQTYNQWARLLRSQGRPAEAMAVLRQGLQQIPDHNLLTMRLAGLLMTAEDPAVRNPDEAVRLATGVCERTGRGDPQALHLLATAYAVAGRCPDAIREARRAIPVAEQAGLAPMVQQLEALIARCASGQPVDIRKGRGRP